MFFSIVSLKPETSFMARKLCAIDHVNQTDIFVNSDHNVCRKLSRVVKEKKRTKDTKPWHFWQYVLKVAHELGAKSYRELVEYLIKPFPNDEDKVRAIFVWIASQGVQRVARKNVIPPEDTPLHLIYNIMVQRRAGSYHDMFKLMWE